MIAVAADAHEDSEFHGLDRRDVALLVASRSTGELVHACFAELGQFLHAGDLLVVNTSATLPAAVPARLDGRPVELHLSTPAGPRDWVVELRTTDRLPLHAPTGERLELPGGVDAELLAPYLGSMRLSVARLFLDEPVEDYLARHGHPIRYRHTEADLPIDAYETVFARDPGSAEMPSAARPFTAELVTELVSDGVLVAPVTLHCGVSSLETGESPYPERYDVPPETARLVNAVRDWGGRVTAVGTTVVRALETVAAPDGTVSAGSGLTNLIVTPERGLHAIDGLITGWHEPESSHLSLLEAAAGPELLQHSYHAAHAAGYRFHEFGDSHLILP
ncbi:MAG TPA: S-adenosylmethionine:tRNA ribosyltransferase-isomerase [Thermoleophilaceae bacterium]|nr:S-adenosylmethionine:tRNA ribosyltransferase-isomerase [Thermoleophilaceae bacterium]